jgi:hypothetical protein
MNWIKVSEIEKYMPTGNILVWQENLSDPASSRFQRAMWFEGSHFLIYPIVHRQSFRLTDEGNYEGRDLEGDLCRITHFCYVERPD